MARITPLAYGIPIKPRLYWLDWLLTSFNLWWILRRPISTTGAPSDALTIWGRQGVGKTRLIYKWITDQFLAGQIPWLIDGAGDLVRDLTGFLAARNWDHRKVVIVDPAYQWGRWRKAVILNPLFVHPGFTPEQVVGRLLTAWRAIWTGDGWGPQTEEILRNALICLVLGKFPLSSLYNFLADEETRQQIVSSYGDEKARNYWFGLMGGQRELKSWVSHPHNKVSQLLSQSFLYKGVFAGTEQTLDFSTAKRNGVSVLIRLPKQDFQDARGPFGSLLLAMMHQAALADGALQEDQRNQCFLYTDETQEFFNADVFEDLLNSRKYKLSLRLASPGLETFDRTPKDKALVKGIVGMAGAVVAFGCSQETSAFLVPELFRLSGEIPKEHTDRGTLSYTLQQEAQHYMNQLFHRPPQEWFLGIRSAKDSYPYGVRSEPVTYEWEKEGYGEWEREQEEQFLEENARVWCQPVTEAQLPEDEEGWS